MINVNYYGLNLAISDIIKCAGMDGEAVLSKTLDAPGVKQAGIILANHLTEMALQDPDQAELLQNTARAIKEKTREAQQGLVTKGYAPLTRYGDHTW